MSGLSRGTIACFAGALILSAREAFAHSAGASARLRDLPWSFEPGVVAPLAIAAVAYGIGSARLWKRMPLHRGLGLRELASFAAGWLALAIALVSPLHPWGAQLFSAHMTQHELLMLVAAPLLVLGRPGIAMLWALPRDSVRQLSAVLSSGFCKSCSRFIDDPFCAWIVHAVALWVWHIPALFESTLRSEWAHAAQHASFLGSALISWRALFHGRRRSLGYGAAVLFLFTTALHSGLLGALLTFARTVWYPAYATTAPRWGLAPLEDQQLGGLIMWIPAGLVYIVAGLALFAGWLREAERREARAIHAPLSSMPPRPSAHRSV